jgi:hypothetical protein
MVFLPAGHTRGHIGSKFERGWLPVFAGNSDLISVCLCVNTPPCATSERRRDTLQRVNGNVVYGSVRRVLQLEPVPDDFVRADLYFAG